MRSFTMPSPEWSSEWRWVVELASLGAAFAVAASVGPLGAGGGPLQRRGDLVRVDLGGGPLVALVGLPRAGPQPAQHHGAVAFAEGFGDVLGLVAPDVDLEEGGVPVPPGTVVLLDALVDRQAEVGDRGAVLGEAQFGVVGEVADLDGEVVACHHMLLSCSCRIGGVLVCWWGGGGSRWWPPPRLGLLVLARPIAARLASWQSRHRQPCRQPVAVPAGAVAVWGVSSAMVWSYRSPQTIRGCQPSASQHRSPDPTVTVPVRAASRRTRSSESPSSSSTGRRRCLAEASTASRSGPAGRRRRSTGTRRLPPRWRSAAVGLGMVSVPPLPVQLGASCLGRAVRRAGHARGSSMRPVRGCRCSRAPRRGGLCCPAPGHARGRARSGAAGGRCGLAARRTPGCAWLTAPQGAPHVPRHAAGPARH